MLLPYKTRTESDGFSLRLRLRRQSLAVLIGLAMIPSGASAYSQLIVFGDSLSDSGQFPDVERILAGEIGTLRFTNREGPTYLAPSPYGEVSTQRLADALTPSGLAERGRTARRGVYIAGQLDAERPVAFGTCQRGVGRRHHLGHLALMLHLDRP